MFAEMNDQNETRCLCAPSDSEDCMIDVGKRSKPFIVDDQVANILNREREANNQSLYSTIFNHNGDKPISRIMILLRAVCIIMIAFLIVVSIFVIVPAIQQLQSIPSNNSFNPLVSDNFVLVVPASEIDANDVHTFMESIATHCTTCSALQMIVVSSSSNVELLQESLKKHADIFPSLRLMYVNGSSSASEQSIMTPSMGACLQGSAAYCWIAPSSSKLEKVITLNDVMAAVASQSVVVDSTFNSAKCVKTAANHTSSIVNWFSEPSLYALHIAVVNSEHMSINSASPADDLARVESLVKTCV